MKGPGEEVLTRRVTEGTLGLQRGRRGVGSLKGTEGHLLSFVCPEMTVLAPDTVQAALTTRLV